MSEDKLTGGVLAHARRAMQTITVHGIELDHPRYVREDKVYYEAGTVFISFELLDELTEADNSWGMGGAFLINDPKVKWALESHGLINVETRGGVYTDAEQRIAIRVLVRQLSAPGAIDRGPES
jgi:hypothetical protein